MRDRDLIKESLGGDVPPKDFYNCTKCKDSGYLEQGAYCDCEYGIAARACDAEEVYECTRCWDSGEGRAPGTYCKCRFGDELLEKHVLEDLRKALGIYRA
jgi:hypothetical protein